MILIKVGEHVNEMMAVAVKKFQNFLWSGFLIIRQNVNMATNAILYCGLPPTLRIYPNFFFTAHDRPTKTPGV